MSRRRFHSRTRLRFRGSAGVITAKTTRAVRCAIVIGTFAENNRASYRRRTRKKPATCDVVMAVVGHHSIVGNSSRRAPMPKLRNLIGPTSGATNRVVSVEGEAEDLSSRVLPSAVDRPALLKSSTFVALVVARSSWV